MNRRGARIGIVATLAMMLSTTAPAQARGRARVASDPAATPASVAATPQGQPMPPGFLGISLEYKAIHAYTGRDPDAVNPVLIQLLRNLTPSQAPVLRIGGDSADSTWWPMRGVIAPGGVTYGLTRGWFRTTSALAAALGARLILGINLAAGRPALAAREGRAILEGIGRRYVEALEIGNEPDLYSAFAWYRNRRGRVFFARRRYGFNGYMRDFSRWRAALPGYPLAGPAFSAPNWMGGLGQLLSAEPRIAVVTYHRYPLRGCVSDPSSVIFPSIPNLLSDSSSVGLAQGVAPYVAMAHARGLQFRVAEMNSASCRGSWGVSDTFASALWTLDALFNLASVGVDGVNFHTLPGAAYELFTFTHAGSQWQAFVHPDYYGLLMFAQADPPGSRLLPVYAAGGPVKVWATLAPDGKTRVALINKDQNVSHSISLQVPGGSGQATLEWLLAPNAAARTAVTLGGQSFGPQTSTGTFSAPPQTAPVTTALGSYSIDLPPASAALLTQ